LNHSLVAGRRYLFKYALPRYSQGFWSEIIASSAGRCFGIPVPAVFPAMDLNTGHVGAPIEWFYLDGRQRFIPGGDLFQMINPVRQEAGQRTQFSGF
jgi:hypothetical protein